MIRTCPTASTSSTSPLIRMNSHDQSSKPPTGRSRPSDARRAPPGAGPRAFGCLDGHQRTPASSRIPWPMIQVIGIMLRTKMAVEASAMGFMCRVVPGQKSKTMIFTPLIAW